MLCTILSFAKDAAKGKAFLEKIDFLNSFRFSFPFLGTPYAGQLARNVVTFSEYVQIITCGRTLQDRIAVCGVLRAVMTRPVQGCVD